MFGTLQAGIEIFRIKLTENLQYRLAAVSGAAVGIFWMLIQMTVYTLFYRYGSVSAISTAALTLPQVITYAWLSEVLMVMQPLTIDGDIHQKIISGDIGVELCRPLDLYTHWFFRIAAGRLSPVVLRGTLTLLAGLAVSALTSYKVMPPASITGFVFFLVSFLCALFLCTAYGALICIVRMNITWGEGPTYMLLLIGSVLSGAYLPLQLWPDSLQKLLMLQPFAGYADIPLRFYLGTISAGEGILAITIQLLWIGLLIFLGKKLLKRNLTGIIIQGG